MPKINISSTLRYHQGLQQAKIIDKDGVKIFIDGKPVNVNFTLFRKGFANLHESLLLTLSKGNHAITIRVYDSKGNYAEDEGNVLVV